MMNAQDDRIAIKRFHFGRSDFHISTLANSFALMPLCPWFACEVAPSRYNAFMSLLPHFGEAG